MVIEIIPNWHPIFVHFTIGLLSISAILYLAGFILKNHEIGSNFTIIGRWNLWLGAFFTLGTVAAGFYAYNTVAHDAPSHAAMTDHKNWALITAAVFWVLALWAFWKQRGAKVVSALFVIIMLASSGLVAVTGYKGGEAVYRYGLGVMSLPKSAGGHDDHEHSGAGHDPVKPDGVSKNLEQTGNEESHGEHEH